MKICRFLNEDRIIPGLDPGTKEEVLRKFIMILNKRKLIHNPEEVLTKILDREHLGSTALNQEIAVPHALISNLENTFIAMGILKEKMNFGIDKEKPVSILILLLGNKDNPGQQLKILAHICRLIKETEVVSKIKQAENLDDICRRIEEEESKII